MLLLLLWELICCTPGGVDNNRSGTIGDGEVIELKLEYAVGCIVCGDGWDNGICCWCCIEAVGAVWPKMPTLSKWIGESKFWFWLALWGTVVGKELVGASSSAGGCSVGFEGSSSSSNMQRGGWLGIWEILQCNKLLSIRDDFGGNVTENEDTNDGEVVGAGECNCCWDTFWRQGVVELLVPLPTIMAVEFMFEPCKPVCNWWNCWNLCCCDDEFGKCW